MSRPGSPLQIAIDGFVATGKSTVGLALAQRLGILYLDTGVMYRAVALAVLDRGLDVDSETACGHVAETLDLRLMPPTIADGRQLTVFVENCDVTWEIRTEKVNRVVPRVSSHPRVRKALRSKQVQIASEQGIVMVGRDITSIVLPHAQVKVLLTASLGERVRRRAEELAQQSSLPVDTASLRQAILDRDDQDTPQMKVLPDVHEIVTDDMSIEQVVDVLVSLIPPSFTASKSTRTQVP